MGIGLRIRGKLVGNSALVVGGIDAPDQLIVLVLILRLSFVLAVHLAFLPEPVYRGPELITYFRGPNLEVC